MKHVVSVEKLSKSFSSEGHTVKALKSVSLEIKKGEVFGLLGPNGAGKTTLIAVLCGFLVPDKGHSTIFGKNCTYESEKIQKRMNFVSGFGGVPAHLTAEELLYIYSMLYNVESPKPRINLALKATGMEKHRKRIAEDFSSGLRRRILISKALLNNPDLLLLDEPTVGLDVDSASRVRRLIRKMKKEGKTILLTTHNMEEAEELCDRVALIKNGSIIAYGSFSELRKKFFPFEVLEIHCKKPENLEKLVSGKNYVIKTKKSGNKIEVYIEGEENIRKILKLALDSKMEIRKVNTVEPELVDVYTRIMAGGGNERFFITP